MKRTREETTRYFEDKVKARKQHECTDTHQRSNVVTLPVERVAAQRPPSDDTAPAPVTPAQESTAPLTKTQMDEIAEGERKRAAENTAGAIAAKVAELFCSFRDEKGEYFIYHGGDAIPFDSTDATDTIRLTAFGLTKRNPNEESLKLVRSILRKAAKARDVWPVYLRIGKDGDAYLLDLGNKAREVLRISAQGVEIFTAESLGVAFKRGPGYAELPEPIMPESEAEASQAVQPLLYGLAERDHLPLLDAMVERLRCDSPHHILLLLGPPGSGKTTTARRFMLAIDPFVGDPPSVTLDRPTITAAAQERHSLLIDNCGAAVGKDIENILCKSAWGTADTEHKYHTQDVITRKSHVAWIITSIGSPLRAPDALERTLVLRVSNPTSATTGLREEPELWAEFAEQHPRLLGGLLYYLVLRMRLAAHIKAQQPIKHREVDFLITGEVIAQARGWQPGEFIKARAKARKGDADELIEGDSFAPHLVAWLHSIGKSAQPAERTPAERERRQKNPWAGIINGRCTIVTTAQKIFDAVGMRTNGRYVLRDARMTRSALYRVQGAMTNAGWSMDCKDAKGESDSNSNKYWVFGSPL